MGQKTKKSGKKSPPQSFSAHVLSLISDTTLPGTKQTLGDWWVPKSIVEKYEIALFLSCGLVLAGSIAMAIGMYFLFQEHMFFNLTFCLSVVAWAFSLDFCATAFFNWWSPETASFQDYPQSLATYGWGVFTTVILCPSCLDGRTDTLENLFVFIAFVVLRDTMMLIVIDIFRVIKQDPNQDNDFRIQKSLEPFLKNWKKFAFEVGKIPILDGLEGYCLVYMGYITTDMDFKWTWMMVAIFPLKMFAADFINDVFYWTMHYFWHKKRFYKAFNHKLHHLVQYPISFIVGIMSTEEMFATFIVTRIITPLILCQIFGPLTISEFALYNCHMGIIEILGHSGQVNQAINNTSRYGQAFLITALGINLEVGHHDLHHEIFIIDGGINFGKRMCFMDKMMGTYKDYREKRSILQKSTAHINLAAAS